MFDRQTMIVRQDLTLIHKFQMQTKIKRQQKKPRK